MDKKYLDNLQNDNFTIETSRTIQNARFTIRKFFINYESQAFIKDTLEKEIKEGIIAIDFEDENHAICITTDRVLDKEKFDYTIYYIVDRLANRSGVKGVAISQLFSTVYIGNHIYIYL